LGGSGLTSECRKKTRDPPKKLSEAGGTAMARGRMALEKT